MVRSLAIVLIAGWLVVDVPNADAQLFRRLRSLIPVPPRLPLPPTDASSRVPRFRAPMTPPVQPRQIAPTREPNAPGVQGQSPTRATPPNSADASKRRPNVQSPDPSSPYGGSILRPIDDGQADNSAAAPSQLRPTFGIQGRNRIDRIGSVEVLNFKDYSLADEAGLQVGDRIYAMNGRPTPSIEAMIRELATKQPGETVRVRIQRGTRFGDLDIPLVGQPTAGQPQVAGSSTPPVAGGQLGVDVKDAAGSRGAVVISVTPNSPAQQAGLEVGDRIVSVDGRMVDGTAGLSREVSQRKPGTTVNLQIVREDKLIASRVTLNDQTTAAKTADQPETVRSEQKVADAGASVLEGVASKLGGLLATPDDSAGDLLPPPAQVPTAQPKAAAADPVVANPPVAGGDALALGDDEPIDQVIFDAFPVEAEELEGPRETEELPSSQAPEKTESEAERIKRLEAEVRRLKEKLETLEESSGGKQ